MTRRRAAFRSHGVTEITEANPTNFLTARSLRQWHTAYNWHPASTRGGNPGWIDSRTFEQRSPGQHAKAHVPADCRLYKGGMLHFVVQLDKQLSYSR